MCTDAASGPDTSLTKALVNEESAPAPTGCQSVGGPVSEDGTVDGRAAKSSPEGAVSGAVAETSSTASEIRAVPSHRDQLLDEWLHSLGAAGERLQRLGELLTPAEKVMLAELASTIGTEFATPTGSRSLREQVLDTFLASITADQARREQIEAVLDPDERDMLAKLGRGLAKGETSAGLDKDASSK